MNKPIFLVSILISSLLPSAASCSAKGGNSGAVGSEADLPVGSELSICRECPPFVRVPDAPANMRPIRYVSKFELTWNNYLAAYDAGRCTIPNPRSGHRPAGPNEILENLESFRIDWPVSQLGPAEVACYIGWLQEKTGYQIALPTGAEWEWFARAGRAGAKFPWGNDADVTQEALFGATIDRTSSIAFEGGKGILWAPGVKVGLFKPNAWGLHDIMGNMMELTSEVISGEEWYRRHPNSTFARSTRDESNVLLKGSNVSDPKWAKVGISDKHYAMIWGGRYTTDVAVRLILIKRDK